MMTEVVNMDHESGCPEASILLVRLCDHLKQLLEVSDASASNSYDVDVPGEYSILTPNRTCGKYRRKCVARTEQR